MESSPAIAATTRDALLHRLADGPDRIAAAAHATRRAAGARRPKGWTARENVAHLVLVERLVFQVRLDQLASGETPHWGWAEPPTSDDPEVGTLDRALETFRLVRGDTVARVAGLDEAGWGRFGHHATYGWLDVAGLLGVIGDHDDHHLADIAALARGPRR